MLPPRTGERSDKRDTEAQLVMVTRDPALRARLTQVASTRMGVCVCLCACVCLCGRRGAWWCAQELKAIGSFSTPVKLSHFEPQQCKIEFSKTINENDQPTVTALSYNTFFSDAPPSLCVSARHLSRGIQYAARFLRTYL